MTDVNALCDDYVRAPTPELRVALLEELYASNKRSLTVLQLAGGKRDLLASEQKRFDKECVAQSHLYNALTVPPTRLAAARARLAAVS